MPRSVEGMSPRVRSAVLFGVVVLLFVAGYLLQAYADSRNEDAPEVPESELTPAATGIVPGPGSTRSATAPPASARTATPAASAAAATAAPSGASRDLSLDEARGGHTIARHVGKSDDELRARLKAEPDISAASTYTDLETAERVVGQVLERKKDEIEKWSRRTGNRPNLALRLDMDEVIGRSVKQGQTRAIDVSDAVVVLRWDGSDWYVLTSYPEDR